jgi:formamidopyrimidine-DNA glycosylase (fpg)
MPELPEVETIARGLAAEVENRRILSLEIQDPTALMPSPETFASLCMGRVITHVGRRAKLLLLHLDDGGVLAVHLRMTGRVMYHAPGEEPDRPRAVLLLEGGVCLSFADVRRFGSMHAFTAPGTPGGIEHWPFYRDLGPEPLEITAEDFQQRIASTGKKGSGKSSRARIKALLLDQHIIAGIGNIYADESLFRAGIRPDTPACNIGATGLAKLFAAIQAVLTQAIAENGSSIRDYRNAHGDAGAFQNSFMAYGREGQPCTVCRRLMTSAKVAGRTSTFCENCQK